MRRDFLRSIAATCTLSAAGLWLPRAAGAAGLSLHDRIERLYSNQLSFDGNGQPQISIGIAQEQTEVLLSAPRGLRVLPSGSEGTEIRGGSRWRLRIAETAPSDQRYAVALDNFRPDVTRAIERARKRWHNRGLETAVHEVGAMFGVSGTVIDTRRLLVTTAALSSRAQAERVATGLRLNYGIVGRLHPLVLHRAHGSMVAEDLDHGVSVLAQSVLWFAPTPGNHITVTLRSTGRSATQAPSYRGQIYVAVDRSGKLSVVNVLGETGVLAGLVPAEMFPHAHPEALKAQAIAARGQLLTRIGQRHRDDPFLLCAHQHCQVYAGVTKEHPRTTAAVQDTAGRVLMRPHAARIANTVYSANSGGHTEDNEHVWPSSADPLLRGRPDPLAPPQFRSGINAQNLRAWLLSAPRTYARLDGASRAKAYRWEASIDPGSLDENPTIPPRFGRLLEIEILDRGCSGRATTVRLQGSRGSVTLRRELEIRRALGGLRSSLFLVHADRDRHGRFRLVGGGHGHGVGMCQHGAMGMAQAKLDAPQILAHYYRSAKLKKLW
ncbi:MAG: SpoIID/LytB domain-containing protein [Nannocystaceae bacterium]